MKRSPEGGDRELPLRGPPVGTLVPTLVGDRELPLRGPPVGTLVSTLVGDRELPLRGPPVGTLQQWRLLTAGPPVEVKVERVKAGRVKMKRTKVERTVAQPRRRRCGQGCAPLKPWQETVVTNCRPACCWQGLPKG